MGRPVTMSRRSRLPSVGTLVPGMAPGAYKRNALVMLTYLLLSFVSLSAAGVGVPLFGG